MVKPKVKSGFAAAPGSAADVSPDKWNLYVRCVTGMGQDELCGRGPTKEAFIQNLRLIADQMEADLENL